VPAARSAPNSVCGSGLPFASCGPDFRNFQSVVLAIHGWNGSCAETFGKDRESFFRIVETRSFYDMDCFEYDTKHTDIQVLEGQLRDRLASLSKWGYTDVMFVTHSLGGVLVLRLLLDDSLSHDREAFIVEKPDSVLFAPNSIRIHALHAWAIPINGLRYPISLAGHTLNMFDFSRATLPALKTGSPFIAGLEQDLGAFCSLVDAAAPGIRSTFKFDIHFYQGEGYDWVVQPFEAADPLVEHHPDCIGLLNTRSGHSFNIGDGGIIGQPSYSSEMMADRALLVLPLSPRIADVFSETSSTIPESLAERQLRVIDGIDSFIRYHFNDNGARSTIIALMRHIVSGHFTRDDRVDEKFAHGFVRAVADSIRNNSVSPGDLTEFLIDVLQQVFLEAKPAKYASSDAFGKGKADPILALFNVVLYIRDTLEGLASHDPAAAADIEKRGGMKKINEMVLDAERRFLFVQHDAIQTAAIEAMSEDIERASTDAIRASGAIVTIQSYAENNYKDFPDTTKVSIGTIYMGLAARQDALSVKALTGLQVRVQWRGGSQPLWVATMSDEQMKRAMAAFAKNPETKRAKEKSELFIFFTEVAARNGASGRNAQLAVQAIGHAQGLAATVQGQKRAEWGLAIAKAAKESGYASVVSAARP
jgi:pimeloyl-ACP methyl ester carboxylesterase